MPNPASNACPTWKDPLYQANAAPKKASTIDSGRKGARIIINHLFITTLPGVLLFRVRPSTFHGYKLHRQHNSKCAPWRLLYKPDTSSANLQNQFFATLHATTDSTVIMNIRGRRIAPILPYPIRICTSIEKGNRGNYIIYFSTVFCISEFTVVSIDFSPLSISLIYRLLASTPG